MMCTRLTQSVINAALAAGLVSYSAQAEPAAASQAEAIEASTIAADTCPPVPDVADKTERARALLARSQCLFAADRIRDCVPVLEEACSLTDSPRCLFNLGAVHHALLHCQLARGYYQLYLDRDPYDVGRNDALSALEELNGVCGPPPVVEQGRIDHGLVDHRPKDHGTVEPQPPQPLTPVAQDPTRRIVAYSLFGAAGATAITAALFGGISERMQRDNDAHAAVTNTKDEEYRSLDRKGHLYNVLGWSFLAGTAALAGTGVLLLVLDSNASSEQSVTVGADGLTSVQYRASF